MKKVALVFLISVFVPSLVLAWLAVRSLRDQQFVLERQRALLYQGVADGLSKEVNEIIADEQRTLASKVNALLMSEEPAQIAKSFDETIRQGWSLPLVGFVVTLDGQILSPTLSARPEVRSFYAENSRFLANRESAEVYLNAKQLGSFPQTIRAPASTAGSQDTVSDDLKRYAYKNQQLRNITPQPQSGKSFVKTEDPQQQLSKLSTSEAEFRQVIGNDTEGIIARFLENKMNLLLWYRPPLREGGQVLKTAARNPQEQLVFGVQVALPALIEELHTRIQVAEPALRQDLCVALLDDNARPVALSNPGFQARWKHPFVAAEIGEALPHWEIAVYLLDPARLSQSAQAVKLTLGLLIAVLVLSIAVGSWLITSDLNRQLTLARQKTDFVSNVSHELKTPLTSIRMFSELLVDGRRIDPEKQRSYLSIIHAETARLTRLINNVLDFARLERGEKKYDFQPIDLAALVRETLETYCPQLEASGFVCACNVPDLPVTVRGDRDALSQVILNLLSNAEKYSGQQREISVELLCHAEPVPYVELKVLDRGLGVPQGMEEKIFEKFYRAHDSLSSGIQGSGLGLTLARQVARAHGGDVSCAARIGGGSCFSLKLPRQNGPENA